METLKIFIGYDPKEAVAFHTLAHSILFYASVPVSITPVNLKNLKGIYKRQHDNRQSNTFSFSRFLVPYLSGYEGLALFLDCDMMLRCDVKELFDSANPKHAVHVVKHDYSSKVSTKYLGTKQYNYPRKNWSSVILWNCAHPKNKNVDLDFVAKADAATLHRFLWLKDEEIGELDVRWNWLVGEYDNPPKDVKNVHWTLGGPYFKEYTDVDFADEWRDCFSQITYCAQLDEN